MRALLAAGFLLASSGASAATAPCSSDTSLLCHDFDYFLAGPGPNSASGTHLISLPLIIGDPSLPGFFDVSIRESIGCAAFENFLGAPGTVTVSEYVASTDTFQACNASIRVREGGVYLVQVASDTSFSIRGRDEGAEAILLGPAHGFSGRNTLRLPHGMFKHEHELASELVADMGGLSPQGAIVSFSRYRTIDDTFETYPGTDFDLDAEIEDRLGHLVVVDQDLAFTADFANRHCTTGGGADECPDGLDCTPCFVDADCPVGEVCQDDGACSVGGLPCHEDEDCPGFPAETCIIDHDDTSVHFQSRHLHATHSVTPTNFVNMRVEFDNRVVIENLSGGGLVEITAPTVASPPDFLRDGHDDWIGLGGGQTKPVTSGSVTWTGDFVEATEAASPGGAARATTERKPKVTLTRITSGTYTVEIAPDYNDSGYGVTQFRIEARSCPTPRPARADCVGGSMVASQTCTIDCNAMPPEYCGVDAELWPTHQWISTSLWDRGLCMADSSEPCDSDADCQKLSLSPATCDTTAAKSTNLRLPNGTPAPNVNTLWIIPLDSGGGDLMPNIRPNRKQFVGEVCNCSVFGSCGVKQSCPRNPKSIMIDNAAPDFCPSSAAAAADNREQSGADRSRGPGPDLVLLDVFFGGEVCGDGIVNANVGENCDDGNTLDGDGCPAACRFVGVDAGSVSSVSPMVMSKLPSGDLELSWSPSCLGTDTDYAIYEGFLGARSHVAKLCSTGGATTTSFPAPPDSHYYLVVPLSSNREGSYGKNSFGAERPQGESACAPQGIAGCP